MLTFVEQHASAISAIVNVLMLLVWVTYLQLLLNNFLRQRRSSIIISSSFRSTAEAQCFISNMSEGRFHIQNITAKVVHDGETFLSDVTEPTAKQHEGSFQIPLAEGQSSSLGTFDDLLDRLVAGSDGLSAGQLKHAEDLDLFITIVGVHGPARRSVAAQRGFKVRFDEEGRLRPTGLDRNTRQYRWGPTRRKIVSEHRILN
ncbi:MAG: hypothetical protein VX593_02785 [Pseudomonadota bacterium]|nr:hypothetical protein [Pseudomonadota bacterium]